LIYTIHCIPSPFSGEVGVKRNTKRKRSGRKRGRGIGERKTKEKKGKNGENWNREERFRCDSIYPRA